MDRYIIYILLIIILPLHVFAQAPENISSPIYENIIPPSPEAANLGKYGDTPISYNTGTPNISIPIYEIKGKEISLPISLTYDSKGNKVQDIASWVGLGWALNAGGVITRTVRGKPDDDYYHNGYFDKLPQWRNYESVEVNSTNYTQGGMPEAKYNFMEQAAKGEIDLLPDAFNFNFGKYSGSIIFQEGQAGSFYPVVSPAQDFKIQHPFDGPTDKWIITTPDGIKYTFDVVERSGNFTSTWYLGRIESADANEAITFTYGSNPATQIDPEKYFRTNTISLQRIGQQSDDCAYPTSSTEIAPEFSIVTKYLSYIRYFKNGKKLMEAAFSSDDESNSNRSCEYVYQFTPTLRTLNSISIYSFVSSFQKSYAFTYSKFGESTCNSKNRLRLDALTEVGKPSYEFHYNNIPLPEYDYMYDHWGYWNGLPAPANYSFIPKLPKQYDGQYSGASLASADRETNQYYSRAGLIDKITYPTGGYTEFEFEGNNTDAYVDNYPAVIDYHIKAYGNSDTHGSMTADEIHVNELWDDGDTQSQHNYFPNVRLKRFTLDDGQEVTVRSYIGDIYGDDSGNYVAPITTRIYRWPITDINNDIAFEIIPSNDRQVFLPEGEYAIVATASQEPSLVNVQTEIWLDYNQVLDNYFLRDQYVGGARIRKITDVGGNNTPPVIREFKYIKNYINFLGGYPDGSGSTPVIIPEGEGPIVEGDPEPESSGIVHFQPKYIENDICSGKLIVTAANTNPYGISRGYHIGYSEVSVVKSGGHNYDNGITVYKFYNSPNPDFRSQVKEISYYDSELNLLQRENNEYYNGFYPETVTGLKFKVIEARLMYQVPVGNQYYYLFQDLDQSSYNYGAFWRPIKSTTKSIFQNGEEYSSTTEYQYLINENEGYDKRYQILTGKIQNINGGELIDEFIYPPQVADGDMVYSKMLTDYNYQHLVKESSSIKDETGTTDLIRSTRYDYQDVGNRYLPIREWKLNKDTGHEELSKEIIYDDEFGNVIEVNDLMNGTLKSYLWDVNGKNPVAEVVNVHNNEIAYCGFENETLSNWIFSNTNELTPLSGLNAMDLGIGNVQFISTLLVGNYKIEIFAKNGSVTIDGNTKTAGEEWTKLTWSRSSSNFTITGNAIIDEVRVMPDRAGIVYRSFFIEDQVGMRSVTDANGNTTYFDYDNYQRLEIILDKDRNISKKIEYQYGSNN